ncbi:MAG: proline racemase family protein, partial [Candidatus Saliniplasma sp.]
NIVVFADGSIDRSPCGTGTCAKMTLLHHKGLLDVNEEYRYRSILGTEFSGRILDTEKKNEITVVKPEITGSAYITGRSTFILDPKDPLTGFSLYK